ncbi:hypothetical protein [Thalassovita sp.]|uniref:hypothetical protein n=1 Tax=Thalassovita sp. TaxID=1979401 RepID=UPI0028811BB4|nr:hypothetical protein [Thalassovita sp.]MDF1802251.1 hypothetical protein [Thalassovita sp.]
MDVIEVTISQMCAQPAARRVSGVVSLLIGGRNIVLHCDATMPDPARKRAALVREAMRQLARMPEHRKSNAPLRCKLIAGRPVLDGPHRSREKGATPV